ncbi:MAG: type I methionyl aminopeptidase [Candidatus Pacebacteria bacterium]|nr:type I methionyl aminopeptidase [Candidatus Paceibacterota bacterium]
MIYFKTAQDISILREGGKKLSLVLKKVTQAVQPGISTADLDKLAFNLICEYGGKPSFLNYQPSFANKPFPSSLCTSINETVVHGLPSEKKILKQGDVISLDLGMEYKGLFTDMAVTVGVGKIKPVYEKLIKITKVSLLQAIKASKINNTLGDIGYAIQKCVEKEGFVIIKDLVGHGVGYSPHEDPVVFNYGVPHQGLKLDEGMVVAIEPMVTFDNGAVKEEEDGSFVTVNGKVSCHFEHTIAITKKGPIVITR